MPLEHEWDPENTSCQSCGRLGFREKWQYYLCLFKENFKEDRGKEDFTYFLAEIEQRLRLEISEVFRKPPNSFDVDAIHVQTGAKLYFEGHKYDCRSNSWPWIKKVAKNCGIDYLKYESVRTKRIAQPTLDTDGKPDLDVDVFPDLGSPNPYMIAELTDLKPHLWNAVAELTPDDRLMIAMYLDNKTYVEMSRTFHIAASTAFNRLHSIFQQIKVSMNGHRRRSKHLIDLVWRI